MNKFIIVPIYKDDAQVERPHWNNAHIYDNDIDALKTVDNQWADAYIIVEVEIKSQHRVTPVTTYTKEPYI